MIPEVSRNQSQLETLGAQALATRFSAIKPVSVSADLKSEYPAQEISRLLGSVLHQLGDRVCPVVHFFTAYEGEGGGGIAFEVALAAAQHSGKRTLFLNMNTTVDRSYQALAQKAVMSVEAFWGAESPQSSPLVVLYGSSLYYADFSKSAASAAANIDLVKLLLAELRNSFDFIVIFSEGAASRGHIGALSALADGAVMVVEAERTRSPVVEQLKLQTETAGGRVIGTVLNRRRFYIPAWAYRVLFGRKS